MPPIEIIRPHELTRATVAAIVELVNVVWPPEDGAEPADLDTKLAQWGAWQSTHFIMRAGGIVLAHALIFRREISTSQGPLAVGALATVCVHPAHRGRGWGVAVVGAAFDYLPELGAEVSLFQTGVPQFYEKLGGRIITNPIFDGTRADGSRENPFWDTCVMIYPAAFAWPDGAIDLNGSGY
ncbi:MAG: GNAT family N-acetyltransferase [Armatimonadota bacterium]|nr:GNAT family N-acetyltransferase [Armatimonadota bacterium]